MSHDIRTPINGIMGMLNIGDHFPEDMEKQAECREKIRGASSFLFELVNDVLDMSKMESGKIELEEVPFDLLDLLDEVVSMIEVQAMGHGLDFIYERHEEIHRQVIGSPVHLRQAGQTETYGYLQSVQQHSGNEPDGNDRRAAVSGWRGGRFHTSYPCHEKRPPEKCGHSYQKSGIP